MDQKTIRLGELFSGPGGLALGAFLASRDVPGIRLQHAWANDIDSSTCETYRRNIPGATPDSVICQDVRNLDFSDLGPIDGLSFGFPCNDFSRVGRQKGFLGEFGPLYKHGVAALDHFSPEWFVAENVGGLRSSNDGEALQQILVELSEAGESDGYELTSHLFKFEKYGVPQARHRVIIVGFRKDTGLKFRVPSSHTFDGVDVTCRTALSTPRIMPDAPNHEFTKQAHRVTERLKHIQPGKNAFNSDLPPHLRLRVKGATLSQIYKRLDPDKPSYTVTGSGGGGTHVYHFSEHRALTNREKARLQTFPDDFVFSGTRSSARKQIGMAVPVMGAKVILEAIFKTLQGVDYAFEESNMEAELEKTSRLF